MALALPLAEMAGAAVAPHLEKMIGKQAYSTLAPLAQAGLHKVVQSKTVKNIGRKLGNKFFGKSKTARKLMNKAANSKVQGVINAGLKAGQGLGMISQKTSDNIMDGYDKALSLHDKLSEFNKPKMSPAMQEIESGPPEITPKDMAAAVEPALLKVPPQHSGNALLSSLIQAMNEYEDKPENLGDIMSLLGL